MLWVVCVRIDMDEASPASQVGRLVEEMNPLLTALEKGGVGRINLAISGAAISALVRHGHSRMLDQIAGLAGKLHIYFIATAHDGALLPLLPPHEIDRQIERNNRVCERTFPGIYVPHALWPPELACSRKVAEAAVRFGFSDLLVDELALGLPVGTFNGSYIPTIEGIPGLFLLPRNRALSRALGSDSLRSPEQHHSFKATEIVMESRFHLVAFELGSAPFPYRSFMSLLNTEPTARTVDLHPHFHVSPAITPIPCSQRSTLEELEEGIPFATWFSPDNDLHALQWRALNLSRELYEALKATGYGSVPQVRRLRSELDVLVRESWWRAATEEASQAPPIIAERADRFEQAVDGLDTIAPTVAAGKVQEIRDLCLAIRSPDVWERRTRRHEGVYAPGMTDLSSPPPMP